MHRPTVGALLALVALAGPGDAAGAAPQAKAGNASAAAVLADGNFEAAATKDNPVPGWSVEIGARNGGEEPLSEVTLDRKEKHGGKASLHLSASSATLAFRIVSQQVEARPGGSYKLSAFTRTKGVRHEQNAKGINQFDNCYLALFLFDGNGELIGKDVKPLKRPDTTGWERLAVELKAPKETRRAEVKMFSSVSGDAWFDDLELTIDGGEPVPAPAVVFAEDFEALAELPPAWVLEVGVRNGGTEPLSTVEVAARDGAGKSKHSLHLGGSGKTLAWSSVNRYFDAAPGDAFELAAQVKCKDVHPEKNVKGIEQFANFHMRLVFLDADGKTLGAPRFAELGGDSSDWSGKSVRAVAPEGASRVLAGLFLSMSGDAWFDDVSLTRQSGGVPAYAGWKQLATAHLLLRYPPDHPRASGMAAYGAQLEEALGRAGKALGVEVKEPITVFLYRDGEQGRSLTGRELDYAEPERRAVHQGPNSTLSHELTHVIALGALGYAQTGLLGEGLGTWLNGAPGEAHHDRAAALLRDGKLPPMDALLKEFRAQADGYAAAGSFCGWFLQAYGLDAFRRLYPLSDLPAAAPAVVKKDWSTVDAEWRAFLAARGEGAAPPADGAKPADDAKPGDVAKPGDGAKPPPAGTAPPPAAGGDGKH